MRPCRRSMVAKWVIRLTDPYLFIKYSPSITAFALAGYEDTKMSKQDIVTILVNLKFQRGRQLIYTLLISFVPSI